MEKKKNSLGTYNIFQHVQGFFDAKTNDHNAGGATVRVIKLHLHLMLGHCCWISFKEWTS